MALIAKTLAGTAAQSVATNRPAQAPRGGSSSNLMGPVDSVSPPSGSALGDGSFSAIVGQGEQDLSQHFASSSHRRQEEELPNPQTGFIEVNSASFASLLELRDTLPGGELERGSDTNDRFAGKLVGKAVAIYENSIEIVSGTRDLRGETISLVL